MATVALVNSVVESGAAWLRSGGPQDGWVELRNGHTLRIAPLTEGDLLAARQRTRQGDEWLAGSRLRRELVAASVNRAYGCGPADEGYLHPQALADRPAGELASVLGAIIRLSGLDSDDDLRFMSDLLP